jgi:metallo-beta-lactamase class B
VLLIVAALLASVGPPDAGSAPGTPAPIFETDAGVTRDAGPPPGDLAKEIIQRVVGQHSDEVEQCYQHELARQSDLFGRVFVQFTIAATGDVIDSKLLESTMGSPAVESCIVSAVRRWKFPRPTGGGIVGVGYPFLFTPPHPIALLPGSAGAGAGAADVVFLNQTTVVHRSTDANGISSNGLIAITSEGLFLVDTASTEAQTEAILDWGDRRLKRPWIGAIITHDHADRDGGLSALQRRHIRIAALDLTVAKLAKRHVRGIRTLFTAKAASYTDPRGFEAYYPGPGHTTDNIVIRLPSVLFGGSLIASTEAEDLESAGDANLAAWPKAVRRVAARYPNLPVLPGQGLIDPSGASYQHTLDLLAAATPARAAAPP